MIDYGLNVKLDRIHPDDLWRLRQWRNDYAVYRWCRQRDLLSEQDHLDWFEKQNKDPSIQMYRVINTNDEPIGVCGLTSIDLVNRNAEFSLYIAPGFRAQGYGKKALKSLITHGFNTYGLQVIWGESFEHNPATQMFIDVGLKLDGIRRQFYFREGRFVSAHLFSILRPEWESSEKYRECRTQKCSL